MSESPGFPGILIESLAGYEPRRVTVPRGTTRAAVILVLRAGAADAEALFIVRTTHEDDPWSGHVALPGGRREPGDSDLTHTALRELREETGLALTEADILGRLDELHPASRHVPPIAITPFVAWRSEAGGVQRSAEIDGHFWAPLSALRAQDRRSSLVLERDGESYRFPTIEYAGHTVWGLTFSIVQNFLALLGDPGARPTGGS